MIPCLCQDVYPYPHRHAPRPLPRRGEGPQTQRASYIRQVSVHDLTRHRLREDICWVVLARCLAQPEFLPLQGIMCPERGRFYVTGSPESRPMAESSGSLSIHVRPAAKVLAEIPSHGLETLRFHEGPSGSAGLGFKLTTVQWPPELMTQA